jgi:prepilin-type N-terminal cleavage/methylation domain-containing protein
MIPDASTDRTDEPRARQRGGPMRSRNAFTLVEMLAVISIMLVLMTVTFGVFRTFAERTGPDAALAQIQAVLNGARSYAATSGRDARILFRCKDNLKEMLEGSTLTLQEYYEVNNTWQWRDVPGTRPVAFHDRVYVCNGLPENLPNVPAHKTNPTPQDIVEWRRYEQQVLGKVGQYAMSGEKLKPEHDEFCIEFCPAGFPPARPKTGGMPVVEDGLTIVKVARGRVTAYAFYAINTNTGTPLIFE